MGKLIDYIRSWLFCDHDWQLLYEADVWEIHPNYPSYHKWVYRCKKCGRKNVIED